MRIQKKLLLAFGIAFAFSLIACKSTPEPEPTPEPVPETKVEEKKPEPAPVKEEKVEEKIDYSEANSASLQKLEDSRDEAINYGGNEDNEEGFAVAEASYESLKASAADSSKDSTKELDDLALKYDALKNYSIAVAKEAEIAENDFITANQEDYDKADSMLTELSWTETFESKSGQELYDMSVEVISILDNILLNGYRAEAKQLRLDALAMKKKADEVKASVSRTADYKAAVEKFQSGDRNYVLKEPELAIADYEDAEYGFSSLYGEILEARAKASAAIEAAKKRVAESKANAEKADAATPLAEDQTDGIEAEDAVLLEEDVFDTTGKEVIELDENIDEEPVEEAAEVSEEEVIEE